MKAEVKCLLCSRSDSTLLGKEETNTQNDNKQETTTKPKFRSMSSQLDILETVTPYLLMALKARVLVYMPQHWQQHISATHRFCENHNNRLCP